MFQNNLAQIKKYFMLQQIILEGLLWILTWENRKGMEIH